MTSLFSNSVSEKTSAAVLDTWVSVLEKEIDRARNLKRIIQNPPRSFVPSDLLKNTGDAEHIKSMATALLRKSTIEGTADNKSYRSIRTANLTMQSDVVSYEINDTNVPGDNYVQSDVFRVDRVVLANATTLTSTTESVVPSGKYRYEESSYTLHFNAGDDTENAVITFSYEVDHELDADLRHIKDELTQHISSTNLRDTAQTTAQTSRSETSLSWESITGKPAIATQAEMETGTENNVRQVSPLLVSQSAVKHARQVVNEFSYEPIDIPLNFVANRRTGHTIYTSGPLRIAQDNFPREEDVQRITLTAANHGASAVGNWYSISMTVNLNLVFIRPSITSGHAGTMQSSNQWLPDDPNHEDNFILYSHTKDWLVGVAGGNTGRRYAPATSNELSSTGVTTAIFDIEGVGTQEFSLSDWNSKGTTNDGVAPSLANSVRIVISGYEFYLAKNPTSRFAVFLHSASNNDVSGLVNKRIRISGPRPLPTATFTNNRLNCVAELVRYRHPDNWVSGGTYPQWSVRSENNVVYVQTNATTKSIDDTTNPSSDTDWSRVTPWSELTTYNLGSVVSHESIVYRCTAANTLGDDNTPGDRGTPWVSIYEYETILFSTNSYYIRGNPIGLEQDTISPNKFLNGTLNGSVAGAHLRANDDMIVRMFSYTQYSIPQWYNLDSLFRNDVVLQPIAPFRG